MADTKEKSEKYKLMRGKHAGFDDEGNPKTFVAGDWLTLTESQVRSLGHKVKAERVLKAEAQVEDILNPKTDATSAMTRSIDQPYAPMEPTEEDSNVLEDKNDSDGFAKQTDRNTDQPADSDTTTTQKDPAKSPTTAAPAVTPAPAKK